MNSTLISFAVAHAAKQNGIAYGELLDFITAYRFLPEFERIIVKHNLEELVHERVNHNLRRRSSDVEKLISSARAIGSFTEQ